MLRLEKREGTFGIIFLIKITSLGQKQNKTKKKNNKNKQTNKQTNKNYNYANPLIKGDLFLSTNYNGPTVIIMLAVKCSGEG